MGRRRRSIQDFASGCAESISFRELHFDWVDNVSVDARSELPYASSQYNHVTCIWMRNRSLVRELGEVTGLPSVQAAIRACILA